MEEGFAGGSMVKNPPANAGDTGSIPKSERSLGGGNGNLGNPKDRGAWWAAIYGVAQNWIRLKRLSSSRASLCEFFRGAVAKNRPASAGEARETAWEEPLE